MTEIRKCAEADRAAVLEYISGEPEMNLFFLGDVENYGVEDGPVSIWAFGGEKWDSLLLGYYDNYVIYSPRKDFDADAVRGFLQGRETDFISGKEELVARLAPCFPEKRLRPCHMSRCNPDSLPPETPAEASVRTLVPGDAETLATMLERIEEFERFTSEKHDKQVAALRTEMEHGSGAWGIFEGAELVSTASTSAANSSSAMVTSVATVKERRGRGLATLTVRALCRSQFAAGRRFLCLFYDNPDAGRIYHRAGFRDVGGYAMLS